MNYLSSNQLKQYKDEGFVSPINIFSKEKAKEIRNEIELIENKIPGELEKSGRYNAHLISPLLDEVTHNSKILDAVQSLIGENILVCGTTLFIKNPNEQGFVSYHQDAKYIGLEWERSIKISVRFLTNEIRADGLEVSIFEKKCGTSNVCQTSKIESTLNNEIKLEILKKAAILVKEDGLRYKEKHGEHKSAFYK